MNLNDDEVKDTYWWPDNTQARRLVRDDALRAVKTAPAPGVNTKSGHKHQQEFDMMTNDRQAWHLRGSKPAMVCPVPTLHSSEL